MLEGIIIALLLAKLAILTVNGLKWLCIGLVWIWAGVMILAIWHKGK